MVTIDEVATDLLKLGFIRAPEDSCQHSLGWRVYTVGVHNPDGTFIDNSEASSYILIGQHLYSPSHPNEFISIVYYAHVGHRPVMGLHGEYDEYGFSLNAGAKKIVEILRVPSLQ